MTPPKLTFFCELEADALKELFADGTLIGDPESVESQC